MNNSIACEPLDGLPRYVVLHHRPLSVGETGQGKSLPRGAMPHFDWMFEHGESLLTWATDSLPHSKQAGTLPAIQLPDHRTIYLTFEGALSGGRGEVTQVEKGCFEAVCVSADLCEFDVTGDREGTIMFQKFHRGDDVTWAWSFRPTRAEAS